MKAPWRLLLSIGAFARVLNARTTSQSLTSGGRSGWLPNNNTAIQQWVSVKASEARSKHNGTLDPVIQAFKHAVDSRPDLARYADQMFVEVPDKYKSPYNETPSGTPELRNFADFLVLLDHIIHQGPDFYNKVDPPTAKDVVGFPINAALDWPMGTTAGYEFFLSSVVNDHMGRVLNHWAKYLGSAESVTVLDGWLSNLGKDTIATAGNNGKTNYTFEQLFACPNISAPYLGFRTWDDYFVRRFNPGIRPIAAPDNGPIDPHFPNPTLVITNACESAPLQLKHNISLSDNFFLKEQPYSLTNMLNFSPLAHNFVGGTVYQAYLSTFSYHRWHAPISGRIVKIENVAGTYYSENLFTGLAETTSPDDSGPNDSQAYISAVATRGIIYIQARDPRIGLMAVVFIGMAEVSSCEFTVKEGEEIVKGQEIGMFHFGGSTHVMVFQPGVELEFVEPIPKKGDFLKEKNRAVGSALAVVVS
ncbi:hypothetical protein B0A50_02262 [Salinomyces thailandicus]|uniref:L-tryptophan decarboxylase PsiD-like domain-containing protein n=1 Tax=Salinomyces thailandicus TaxID=706561 RepID=A0A4U0UAE3_9PEZI|nr:hypothetical protein B0A50_02262 [Salinomyces thailandica]